MGVCLFKCGTERRRGAARPGQQGATAVSDSCARSAQIGCSSHFSRLDWLEMSGETRWRLTPKQTLTPMSTTRRHFYLAVGSTWALCRGTSATRPSSGIAPQRRAVALPFLLAWTNVHRAPRGVGPNRRGPWPIPGGPPAPTNTCIRWRPVLVLLEPISHRPRATRCTRQPISR